MAKTTDKKISVGSIEPFIDGVKITSVPFTDDETVTIDVKSKLTFEDSKNFVMFVVDGLTDSRVVFYPKEYLVRACFVDYFTNIRMPVSLEKQYDFLFSSAFCKFYEKVLAHDFVNMSYYNMLLKSIDQQLAFEISEIQNNRKKEIDDLITGMKGFSAVFKDIDMDTISKALPELLAKDNVVSMVKDDANVQ